jgi:hypothetical protein
VRVVRAGQGQRNLRALAQRASRACEIAHFDSSLERLLRDDLDPRDLNAAQ